MIAGSADDDKAGEKEDTVSNMIVCAVTIHPGQKRDTNEQQAYPAPQRLDLPQWPPPHIPVLNFIDLLCRLFWKINIFPLQIPENH